ncbi:ceramide synthase 1 [Exaiptasia diaphana]|uniref:TLC domain-containing protein n=1 Tax=Exaiptasia diaphana TaxID=2652724 RepID=A0A913XAM2_EXADI|nr:ceramide synthase 1 [Exaiptasia diaphana]KXJ13604.1 Ceramide synthase 1 [Exaiptasia diaphana]
MASNYVEIFTRIWETFCAQWKHRGPTETYLQDFVDDLHENGVIRVEDILTTIALGVAFTLARYVATAFIFKPLALYFKFIPKDVTKFPESAWKVFYYFSCYMYCCYILYCGKYSFIEDPDSVWTEMKIAGLASKVEIPSDIYILYVIQTGFYLHSIYATFFMDKWRKDSIVMILHHVLTICLLAFSFAIRYHNIGVIVLYLHDIADVFLEFTKICVCFKSRSEDCRIADRLVNFGFLMFAFVWAKCRLYQYPYRVLYVTGHTSMKIVPEGKFYLFFNFMLWALFVMNIYWFHFIILLIWRVIKGESREVEDVRELSKEETKNNFHKKENGMKNGKTNGHESYIIKSKDQAIREEKNGIIDKAKHFPHQRRKKNLQGN